MLFKRFIKLFKRLFVRLYLFNIFTIIISAIIAFMLVKRYGPPPSYIGKAEFIITALSKNWDAPDLIAVSARKLTNSIALYDLDNRLIFTTTTPALRPLTSKERQLLNQKGACILADTPTQIAVTVVQNGKTVGYGLYRPISPGTSLGFLLYHLLLLIILALFSVITAQSIANPLKRLSNAAQAFGKGDFTVRTHLNRQDELGYLATAFDEMAERINRLMKGQKELLANISHELRTPISRIKVALDIAAEDGAFLDQKQCALIAEDLNELERLITDIFLTARLDIDICSGQSFKLPLCIDNIEIATFMNDCIARFLSADSSHPIELKLEDSLGVILADPLLIRRVLNNLLDNGCKYSNPGSPIIVKVYSENSSVVTEVIDHGIGIEKKVLEIIFNPFFRISGNRTHAINGIGLGLTLSRRIVEAHGGSIIAASTVTAGTTIRFTLPRNSPKPLPSASEAKSIT